ncbi:hypothetical protein D1825_03035 [Cellulomonas rhizosphaerae]|uniref:Uncharacterized protein n=1 Tax=Cellulomonas rhizosphaerae TaxID=2293719 RepID=A0A413RQ76_9CELL|nr:hypothetical protein D1825_03035 [Cellulomonas rhizosphaerae]
MRVEGFEERAQELAGFRPDLLGRFDVILVREADHRVSVASRGGQTLGHLPTTWVQIIGRELQRFETAGVEAVTRSTLTGTKGDRDLCVLLSWPSRDRAAIQGVTSSRRSTTTIRTPGSRT